MSTRLALNLRELPASASPVLGFARIKGICLGWFFFFHLQIKVGSLPTLFKVAGQKRAQMELALPAPQAGVTAVNSCSRSSCSRR